jgi:hypothetical protein
MLIPPRRRVNDRDDSGVGLLYRFRWKNKNLGSNRLHYDMSIRRHRRISEIRQGTDFDRFPCESMIPQTAAIAVCTAEGAGSGSFAGTRSCASHDWNIATFHSA